ncbi:hypothetical protein AAKU52_001903 [Pedobacter sp. CG_S7]|uniref:pinensin family lanthipeptide n=1 Tax=Pedobacter sp. CG_S7 TaxID=3143930 RepID=UPI0033954D2B
MKNSKSKLSLDELQVESFVTSIGSELSQRIAGGLGVETHPTHTEASDPKHPKECTCPSQAHEFAF